MPNLDGTGPMGQGSLTGRGRGKCSAGGQGRGFGQRGAIPVSLNKEDQKNLKNDKAKKN